MASSFDPRAIELLEEMGIDVWRPRQRGVAPVRQTSAAGAPEAPSEPVSVTVTPGRHEPAATAPATTRSAPEAPPPRDVSGTRQSAVMPFTVLCLSKAGSLLLIEPADPRPARRFAADLLAAVTGTWGGETRQLVFEWPQPGIDPSADGVARALGAFVGKQLSDHPGALILVGAEVAARLAPGTLPEDCLVLPRFDALMTDGKLKRALWHDVGSRRPR